MSDSSVEIYDVLIMGAGFAGLCQARHLMLKTPGLKVALVDPKGTEVSERDLKVGESLVEISAMFLYRELELQDYLIENHPPKFGLNFHWPKRIDRTETIDDYYHVWTNAEPHLPSYQLNRAKFESDLLQMCIEMGVDYIRGKVTDVDVASGSAPHRARVRAGDTERELAATHLIDAAGRKFLLGRKLDNLVTGKEEMAGLDTGSAWLRVDGVDRSLFQNRREETNGSSSHYYGTNHWFGHGHWVWMIPIERETRTLSIGVVHHREVIESGSINSREKFLSFLQANHTILYNLIRSGEIRDFKYLPLIAHGSREMISEDRWYVIGEAANMYDPFYSTGLVLAAHNIELVTEVIRSQLAGESDYPEKRSAYNAYIMRASKTYNQVYRDHARHLGDAGAMSWRTYMESTFWFGILVPGYTGKWHFELDFIERFLQLSDDFFLRKNCFISGFYAELDRAQRKGTHIGMLNYTRTDQLALGFHPLRLWDSFRENSKYEHRRLNVMIGIRNSIFFLGLLYARLRILNSGWLGLLTPATIRQLATVARWTALTTMGEWIHRWEVRRRPCHSKFAAEAREFRETYDFKPELMPWDAAPAETDPKENSSRSNFSEVSTV